MFKQGENFRHARKNSSRGKVGNPQGGKIKRKKSEQKLSRHRKGKVKGRSGKLWLATGTPPKGITVGEVGKKVQEPKKKKTIPKKTLFRPERVINGGLEE